MPDILKSWKTTLAGIALLGLTAAFLLGKITLDQFLVAFGVFTGAGIMAAKDADVSHGMKP